LFISNVNLPTNQKGFVMSIFNTILEKLGIKKAATPPSTGKPYTPPASPDKPYTPPPSSTGGPVTSAPTGAPVTPRPASIPVVDVVSKLTSLAGSNSGLDWKVSIVDLLKLLGIDSSLTARKDLAKELGCPEDLMKDSAKMNTWLHKTVLQKIAENGGNIPESLLH
jgi:hypothetical protein